MIIKALPEHEIMRRARWLVENLAVPERRGSMVYRSYTNSVITVVWETPHHSDDRVGEIGRAHV